MQTEIFQQKYGKKMTILSKSSIVIESGIILTEKMRRKIQQEEERMRGVETRIQEIRHAIFTEVAKMAYDVDSPVEKTIEEIPYRVIPGEVGNFRNDVFLERAIVGERLRLAMGLPCRSAAEHAPISDNIKLADQAETYYTPPLINVIKFACNACHEKRVLITEGCQGCLAHPCVEVCPKKAITLDRTNGRSYIDQDKCVKCGQCAKVCGYQAIIIQERPCARACGMDAIGSDENGKADIDYEKCVSCGQCLVNCPFGAIVDKGQIFQLIQSIKRGDEVVAIVAPAFINQFPGMTPSKLKEAMRLLGFADVAEVAIGADLCTIDEAKDFMEEVPAKIPFMGTSCCPAWSVMAKKLFPQQAECISMAMTPMVLTARLLKKEKPEARICFVGPCAAKKLEASRRSVRSEVDFVLTFEELMGLFEAKEVDFASLPNNPEDAFNNASADARGFAASGGVAQAVVNAIKKMDPDREVKVMSAQGLADCKKMMMMAKAGKYNGYLLEGMACPGGCIAGAGTLADPAKSVAMLNKYKNEATMKVATETPYQDSLDLLHY